MLVKRKDIVFVTLDSCCYFLQPDTCQGFSILFSRFVDRFVRKKLNKNMFLFFRLSQLQQTRICDCREIELKTLLISYIVLFLVLYSL